MVEPEKQREYILNGKSGKEGDFALFDILTTEEIESLLKSNRFSWAERKIFKFYLNQRAIKDLLPIIAMVGIAYAVRKILNRVD